MSVRAYNERRKQYRKTQGTVSNPGQPSLTNRAARREGKRPCDCGQCLPGQDRECPARAIARAERLMGD